MFNIKLFELKLVYLRKLEYRLKKIQFPFFCKVMICFIQQTKIGSLKLIIKIFIVKISELKQFFLRK